jgi:hypothetical protein
MSTSGKSSSRDGILAEADSRRGQESYRRPILLGSGALLAGAAVVRLGLEVHRLLFVPDGPLDLLLLSELIRDWLADTRVYVAFRGAVHPPGVFLLLWPIYGWAPPGFERWFYALVTALVTAALAAILVREARPESREDRILLAALVVLSYATAITIGNGQITLFMLLPAVAAVLIATREPPGWGRDAALGGLFLFALVKPNITLPFFWVIAFTRGWTRPAAFALVAYLGISALSIGLHGTGLEGVRALIQAWYERGEGGFATTGYGNLHQWLGDIGLRDWIFPASGVVFGLHGAWAWRHREADLWVRIGVAAIVARLWAYHRVYDDLLLVLPLIALYRLATETREAPGHSAGVEGARGARLLFALGSVALMLPVTMIVRHASWTLVTLWIAQLAFLMRRARGEPGTPTGE